MKTAESTDIVNMNTRIFIRDKLMTDREIVDSLISRDESVTYEFFWVKCRPLFCSLIFRVFHHQIDANSVLREDEYYDEVVNIVYEHLMKPGKQDKDDAHNLKTFNFQCSIFLWIKMIALRLLLKKKSEVIENFSTETPFINEGSCSVVVPDDSDERDEIEEIFSLMTYDSLGKKKSGKELSAAKKRIELLRKLVINEEKPAEVAKEMNIKVSNLYNMKKRAMADFAKAAYKERNSK